MSGARVGSTSLENLGVGTSHHVGHHATAGEAHDIDLFPVALVPVKSVVDHGDDATRIAASIVGKTGRVVDIPAVALVRGARVDEDEAVLVGERGQSGAAEPLLASTSARMKLWNNTHRQQTSSETGGVF